MKHIAFFDVDTQHDFMDPRGALYVNGAEALWPNLKKLTDFAEAHRIPVVASADAHAADDPEFKRFPPHCVKGTRGALRIPETRIARAAVVEVGAPPRDLASPLRRARQVVIEKRTFDVFSNPACEPVVKAAGASDWVVYGVATDFCVRAAALGLRKRGYDVTVVEDAVKGIAPESESKAFEELKAAGCRFITTDVLLKTMERRRSLTRGARKRTAERT